MDIEKEARTRTLIELEYKKPNVSEWLLGVFFVDGMLNEKLSEYPDQAV